MKISRAAKKPQLARFFHRDDADHDGGGENEPPRFLVTMRIDARNVKWPSFPRGVHGHPL